MDSAGLGGGGKLFTEQELVEIAQAAKETEAAQKKFKPISLILTFAILITFIGFGMAYYSALKKNFSEEKIKISFNENANAIMPEISASLAHLIQEVGPVYSGYTMDMLGRLMPTFAQGVRSEISRIGKDFGNIAKEQLQQTINNALKKGVFEDHFPKMTPEHLAAVKEEFTKDLHNDLLEISDTIIKKTSAEIVEIGQTLDQFDIKNMPSDEDRLSRMIVHNLLMLLDKEIVDGGKK